jgi:SAM-dependent methyltransferase
MLIPSHKDPLGKAMLDYLDGDHDPEITVKSNITEDDVIPVDYLFRTYQQMPRLEQKALDLAQGRILDVGCGTGSHSLYLVQKKKEVTAIDASPNAVACCQQRGLNNVAQADYFEFSPQKKFDTLLFMMNGIGIAGEIAQLPALLAKAKELLAPGGQILLDSSDIRYMFEDDDSPFIPPEDGSYYGEVTYQMQYKNVTGNPFRWLFIDLALLKQMAEMKGFKCQKIVSGPHYDYLARLTC